MRKLTREKRTRIYLETQFDILFLDIKHGYFSVAKERLEEINGIINYAHYFDEISDANYKKIQNLLRLIRRKYHII